MSNSHELVEHFFRRQSGRLTAVLTKALGPRQVGLVEDVVQAALLQALRSWSKTGTPTDPAAWMFRVAKNLALDALRRDRRWNESVKPRAADVEAALDAALASVRLDGEIADDQLRLLFLCCHPSLTAESQVAFALRTLGGFSPAEIARALLTTPTNIHKRLVRARETLRNEDPAHLDPAELQSRFENVLAVLYLMFNEGYASCHSDRVIREDLCEEALRLALLLGEHDIGKKPATFAMLSLMYFHVARFSAREDDAGRLLLLDQQDRGKWDPGMIRRGLVWLNRSATGDELTHYHLEAGIAAEHCLAASFEETNWARILMHYDLLVATSPTPVNRLNRAIALAHLEGPERGLEALSALSANDFPSDFHLRDAALGELHRRADRPAVARSHFEKALALATSSQERELLQDRIRQCLAS